MFGVFTEVGGTQFTPQQKPKAVCKIRDDMGAEHKVHIHQGKGYLPGPTQLNQRCQFSLSTFQGNYQGKPYTGYSGFWNQNAQVQPQAPQQPQQPAQGTTQGPNGEKDMRIVRGNALNAIMSAAAVGPHEIREYLLTGVQFILTGEWDFAPSNQGLAEADPPPAGDDDIPF
jgi:hypothetical protein